MINAKIVPIVRFHLELDFSEVVKLGEEKTQNFLDFLESLVFNTLELYTDSFWDGLDVSDKSPLIKIDQWAITEEQLNKLLIAINNWSDQQNNLK